MTTPTIDKLPAKLPDNPMHWAEAWLARAFSDQVQRNPHAMTLATVSPDGQPAARAVLCKSLLPDPGYLVFYTNYRSVKARHLESSPKVAALFHWDAMGLQVRFDGEVIKSPAAESDAYFATRDWGSQLGAWGSDQSQPIASRAALIAQVGRRAVKLGVDAALHAGAVAKSDRPIIARPPHWGGYRIWPHTVELWMEGSDRVHDRAQWTRDLTRTDDGFDVGRWSGTRLQP